VRRATALVAGVIFIGFISVPVAVYAGVVS
jgi:hypothetical protein